MNDGGRTIVLLVGGAGLAYIGFIMFAPQGKASTSPPAADPTPAPGARSSQPRGIRNNNPCNIEFSAANPWRGQVGSDGRFCKFDTPINGIRAAIVLLRNYCTLHQLCTLQGMAGRWAPSPENNPSRYATTWATLSGLSKTAALNLNDRATVIRMIRGMIGVENGGRWSGYYSDAVMNAAFDAA